MGRLNNRTDYRFNAWERDPGSVVVVALPVVTKIPRENRGVVFGDELSTKEW